MSEETPVINPRESAWREQLAVLARDLMKCAGAGLFTDGVINGRPVEAVIGVAVSVAPIVYAQLRTLWIHRQLVFVAKSPRVPSDIAALKVKP